MHKKQIYIVIPAIALFFFLASTLIVESSVELTDNKQKEENNILMTFSREEEDKPNLVKVIVTAYSSTVWQTNEDPFTTASGIHVKEGIVANNMLPFGTEIKIPEYFGDKVFIVEDRMNRRKGPYWVDIWFATTQEAVDFGIREAYIEILEI
jgi:3D (Asp-Asp-Asp) domain-containing protein